MPPVTEQPRSCPYSAAGRASPAASQVFARKQCVPSSISTTLTGDSGETYLSYLTDSQREKITALVDIQRADLNEIVTTRHAIASELRRPLTGGTIDENAVRTLSARYGELDGEISYYYATHFADVGKTLTSEQKAKMISLRNLAGYTCEGAYLYSQPISMPQNIPSHFLFGSGTYDATAMTHMAAKPAADSRIP